MARRTLNRKDLRADYDAAERRQHEEERAETEEDGDEVSGEEEERDELDAEGDEEPEEKPKKSAAKPARSRSRARPAKITRLKVVWGVFNNANQRVAVFNYAQRREADELAAKLKADKKVTHFVQPVKEPLEEKTEG
jgi:hypothetical protein